MQAYKTGTILWTVALTMITSTSHCHARAGASNHPPTVSILWPRQNDVFSATIGIKIQANAADPDGSVAQVQFFADTNLIGVVTNPPFNLVWQVLVPCGSCWFQLKAIAVDNLGAMAESAPVMVYQSSTRPPFPVVEIVSPRDRALFSAPATIVFSAEVLASLGDAGPVEFFVGTNSVGLVDAGTILTATTPPSSVTVSNLLEGDYKFTVRYRGQDGGSCLACLWNTNTIHVVKLVVQSPSLTPDGQFQFEVLTSFPGKPTIIQSSPNLLDWVPISTNTPASNTFTFTDPSPATNAQHFYRLVLPAE